jgi:hypothetical protein
MSVNVIIAPSRVQEVIVTVRRPEWQEFIAY